MASVITVVVKVIGHETAPKRIPVAAKVGSLREAAKSERLKHQSLISRKGSLRKKKRRARQRKKRTGSLTGSSKPGLIGRQTQTKRT
jgi:hypothetical protein